ncbi:hypothetical protein B0H21DRAFT_409580 [Amylocystis lapponica]|nr:hypothetical protein B0H21DRAFT_409580 [Amylocystis lapponica]
MLVLWNSREASAIGVAGRRSQRAWSLCSRRGPTVVLRACRQEKRRVHVILVLICQTSSSRIAKPRNEDPHDRAPHALTIRTGHNTTRAARACEWGIPRRRGKYSSWNAWKFGGGSAWCSVAREEDRRSRVWARGAMSRSNRWCDVCKHELLNAYTASKIARLSG